MPLKLDEHLSTEQQEILSLPDVDSRYVPKKLTPDTDHYISTSVSLFNPEDVEKSIGFKASVPAVIEAGDSRLFVVDMRSYAADENGVRKVNDNMSVNADFLLISPEEWKLGQNDKGFKGIRSGETTVFGRKDPKTSSRFMMSDMVSREHFSISYNNRDRHLKIVDLNSTNGTSVMEPDYTMDASRTINIQQRLRDDPQFKFPDEAGPNGYFNGDPIIGRNSPRISGGVYLGGGSREAITVKPDEDPRIENVYLNMKHKKVISSLINKVVARPEVTSIDQQLQQVYETVRSVMRYDGSAIEAIAKQYSGDRPISLGEFIEEGIGVCRH